MNAAELTNYLNTAVASLVTSISKNKNPGLRELLFLRYFSAASVKAAEKRADSDKQGLHVPAFLIASITNSCNLACSGCYARENHICGSAEAGKELLAASRWNTLFTEAEDMGISFCLLAGGEPLLRPDVLRAAAHHRRMVFPVFTNGTLFSPDKVLFFHRHRNMIPVMSIEGSRKTTDLRRGEGTFNHLEKTAAAFHARNLIWGASVTVTTRNISEVTSESFVSSLYQSGCRLIFYIEYVPVTPGTEVLAPQEAERKALAEAVASLRNTCTGLVFLCFPGDEKYMGGCLAGGRGFFHINPYGGAEPCPFSPYSTISVVDHSLRDVLDSSFFTSLHRSGLTGAEHQGGCALFEQRSTVATLLAESGTHS